ncbi:MAG: alcohol dehydrogenase catalytic domain-containing protein [Clostridia bacterium]|nr:alcohol dehydrogenase catalytic domain-containing protein [Clostridia bacterium]
MRALMYYGPMDMRLITLPDPEPADGQVLLGINCTGICGSDVHGFMGTTGRRTPPMVMGHEFTARVVKTGAGVTKCKTGDRLTVFPLFTCGLCEHCKNGMPNRCEQRRFMGTFSENGAFAEYICCGGDNVITLPDTVDDATGALIEPLAVAYAAVKKAPVLTGKTVVVVGSGTIGLLILKVVKHFGAECAVSVDISEHRRAAAEKSGADVCLDPRAGDIGGLLEERCGRLADVSFEAVGNASAARISTDCLKIGGTAVWVGNSDRMIDIDMQRIVTRELSVLGSYIYRREDYEDTVALLGGGKIDVASLISETVAMDEAVGVFNRLAAGDTETIKVLVDMRK